MPRAHQKNMLFCVSCPNFKIVLYNLKAYINQSFYSAVLQKLVWVKNICITLMFCCNTVLISPSSKTIFNTLYISLYRRVGFLGA